MSASVLYWFPWLCSMPQCKEYKKVDKLKHMQHRFSSNDRKYDRQRDVVFLFSFFFLMTSKTSSYIWVVRFIFWIIPYILHWIVWPLRFVAFLDLDNRGNYQEKSTKMYHTGLTCFKFFFCQLHDWTFFLTQMHVWIAWLDLAPFCLALIQ